MRSTPRAASLCRCSAPTVGLWLQAIISGSTPSRTEEERLLRVCQWPAAARFRLGSRCCRSSRSQSSTPIARRQSAAQQQRRARNEQEERAAALPSRKKPEQRRRRATRRDPAKKGSTWHATGGGAYHRERTSSTSICQQQPFHPTSHQNCRSLLPFRCLWRRCCHIP